MKGPGFEDRNKVHVISGTEVVLDMLFNMMDKQFDYCHPETCWKRKIP